MHIQIDNLILKTYSQDLICIQKDNTTVSSSFDIRTPLKYLLRNGYEDVKNRVETTMIDLKGKTIDASIIVLETKNYKIKKDGNINYEVKDKTKRNNVRWVNRINLLQKLYLLEINRLASTTVEELVSDLEMLNNDFKDLL